MDLININSKRSLSFKNLSATTAQILIYGDIGGFWDDSVTANDFAKRLEDLPDTVNEITVRVNSPGGDVFEGFAIYNLLKQHKAKVTVMIDGWAASIASIIALAGDDIVMGEGSLFMIHKPWTYSMGNSKDLENTIETLDLIEDQLVNIYHRATGLDKIELRQLMAAETWFDANQSVKKGFASRKMESEENLNMAASAKFSARASWINKKPQVVTDAELAKQKIKDFKEEAEGFTARK